VHAISLADFALTTALGWAAQSLSPRLHLRAEIERLQQRPHYPPTTRLAILELRAARGWSLAQAARTFFVTPATIASWTARVDEEGPDAIVRLSDPVNKFPDFVGYLVRHLKILCLTLGKVKIDQILARAGSTSVPRQCAGCCGRHDRRSPARLSR